LAEFTQTSSALDPEARDQLAPRKIPVQERSKKTVGRILDTAAELIDEAGVASFTMNMLAQRSGIRIRTIYRYFSNKLDVLTALLLRLNHGSAERLQIFSEVADPERDWRELIDSWIEELMVWTREEPGARLLMGWSHSIPELMALQDRLDEEWAYNMASAMRRRGVELPPNRLYAVCRSFSEVLDSLSVLASSHSQDRSAAMVDEMRRVLVAYLGKYLD
jgi:AcrR family transcriptional regulator